jgi:hypothetical protein
MPGIIDSSPDCVTHNTAQNADDIADFIIQQNFQDCAGFMTFGPGSTWGEGGASAAGTYYVLIWIGAAVMVAAFVAWVIVENKQLVDFTRRRALGGNGQPPAAGMTEGAK